MLFKKESKVVSDPVKLAMHVYSKKKLLKSFWLSVCLCAFTCKAQMVMQDKHII